jgi:hypothetical protein
MTDEALCAAVQDWRRLQQIWRQPGEAAAAKAAHASLDEFLQPKQEPEPPTEGVK